MDDKIMHSEENILLRSDQIQDILNTFPCGVVIIARQDGRITHSNRRARMLYGMDPDGLTMAEHPKIGLLKLDGTPYPPEEMPASRSLLHGEEVHGEELILARPDGTQVVVSASSAPVYDENGEITAAIGVFDDVTEHRRLEQELAIKNQAVESAAFAIGMADLQGNATYVNQALLDILGYDSRDEVLGKGVIAFWADRNESEVVRDTVLKQGKWQGELDARRKDGSSLTVMVSANLVLDAAGRALAIIASFVDISRRKQMETEMVRHREHLREMVKQQSDQLIEVRRDFREKDIDFRNLIECNADAMMVIDESGCIRFANAISESLFGEKQIGKTFGFPAISGTAEMEIVSGDGKSIITEMKAVEIEWEGKPAHLATFRDITCLKRAGDTIRELSDRLVAAHEKERRTIGHELHDEVGGLLTALKMALHKVKRNLSEAANSELEHVDTLLDKTMNTVSTLSHSMRPEVLDDLGLAEALQWYFGEYTRNTDIRVNFSQNGLDKRLPVMVEQSAYRIVQEALTNATRYAGVSEVTVCIEIDSGKLNFRIEDQGCGFDPNQISSISSGISGMQDRAFLAGGELTVNSSPGEGTCVRCEIPLSHY